MPPSVTRVLFRIENIREDIQGRIIFTRFRNHFREGRNHPTIFFTLFERHGYRKVRYLTLWHRSGLFNFNAAMALAGLSALDVTIKPGVTGGLI